MEDKGREESQSQIMKAQHAKLSNQRSTGI